MTGTLTPSQLDRLAELVRTSTALVFPDARRPLLNRAAVAAMREAGLADPEELVRLASTDAWQTSRIGSLATVGETYLFRHPAQLDELRRVVIEPLVAERRAAGNLRLRVWSAGCSGGEEAYTLAVLLAESIPDLGRWDVSVVGTDLNPEALDRARLGSYGRWSIRGSLEERRRWLQPTGDGVRVDSSIRRMVTFEQHNLAALPTMPTALRQGEVDLIVCRNVMIYLDRSELAGILDGFHRSLVGGGWLVVSPVESSIGELRHSFETWPTAEGAMYRRPHPTRGVAVVRVPAREPAAAASADGRRPTRGRAGPRAPAGTTRHPAPRGIAPSSLSIARDLADGGRLPEARAACLQLLRADPTSTDGLHLLASIAEAEDDLDGAADALRRLLYLDRGHAFAHFRLGLLEWRRGETRRSRARLQRALELLESDGDEEPVGGLAEFSPARLRSVIGALLG